MCTRKTKINIKLSQDKLWKIPYHNQSLQQDFINNGSSKIWAKCGVCYECKKERARNWTYKLWLESKNYEIDNNCFLTLTYKDTELDKEKSLRKKHLQDFIKRLRKNLNLSNIKYFGAGEYGEKKGRAHYHLIILGYRPDDLYIMRNTRSKKNKILYGSETIKKLWGKGRITVQPFAKNEVGYLTLYIQENRISNQNINNKIISNHKKNIKSLQLEYGILNSYQKDNKTFYQKIKNIKDLSKEQHKQYKHDYNKILEKRKYIKEPEFNVWSKNIGFKTFINNEWYKYNLNIDNYTYEIPKEYLRKVLENNTQYTPKTLEHIEKIIQSRNKWIDENKLTDEQEKQKELTQLQENKNNIKLYKKSLNDTF